jgi:hypothetical protein
MPKRFPPGTRYVVEGRATAHGQFRVFARYLVYPDGRRVAVPGDALLPISCCGQATRRSRRTAAVLQLGA